MPGRRTSDALLIPNNFIEYYCKKNSQHIFGCFVDFSIAFDSVPRNTLFQKLLNFNINGKFYDSLTHIYTNDTSCVKIGDNITQTFITNQGVEQGCILSPILINIFLSDIQTTLEKNNCEHLELSENNPLGCLIWADDLLLLSKCKAGLQNMLSELKHYTETNGMKLNLKKTKVMIFKIKMDATLEEIYFLEMTE